MLELISIHIHKTAGRSMKRTLRSIYGRAMDKRHNYGRFKEFSSPEEIAASVGLEIKVVHSHLRYEDVQVLHKTRNPRVITCMRHPVDRVISNYFFRMRKLEENPDKGSPGESSWTLLEYAESKANHMSKMLHGLPLEDIFFILMQDRYSDDLQELGRRMNWTLPVPEFRENTNATYKNKPNCATRVVTEEMREQILQLNYRDIELYNSARKLRGLE